MTSQQLLDKLGVTAEQAEEYKARYSEFVASLPPDLATLHAKTQAPVPLDQIKSLFGPDLTQEDLTDLYASTQDLLGVVTITNVGPPGHP
jgi:hypothetical protein